MTLFYFLKLFYNLYIPVFFILFLCTICKYTLKEVLICALPPVRKRAKGRNNAGELQVLKENGQTRTLQNNLRQSTL